MKEIKVQFEVKEIGKQIYQLTINEKYRINFIYGCKFNSILEYDFISAMCKNRGIQTIALQEYLIENFLVEDKENKDD